MEVGDLQMLKASSAMERSGRAEPVASEDKPKLLKVAFLQFCR